MGSRPESPKMQEMGPKRYRKMIEDNHKFYDKYKAGKTDPVTGVYYHDISFRNPNKRTNTGPVVGEVPCFYCDNPISIKRSTVSVICGNCHKNNVISFDGDLITWSGGSGDRQ